MRSSLFYNILKSQLNKKNKDRTLFLHGPHHLQLLLSCICMGCSALYGHLFHFLKVVDNPTCACGFHFETPHHYFLSCSRYTAQREILMNTIGNVTDNTININTLLFRDKKCSLIENKMTFDAVFDYIKCSKII